MNAIEPIQISPAMRAFNQAIKALDFATSFRHDKETDLRILAGICRAYGSHYLAEVILSGGKPKTRAEKLTRKTK